MIVFKGSVPRVIARVRPWQQNLFGFLGGGAFPAISWVYVRGAIFGGSNDSEILLQGSNPCDYIGDRPPKCRERIVKKCPF